MRKSSMETVLVTARTWVDVLVLIVVIVIFFHVVIFPLVPSRIPPGSFPRPLSIQLQILHGRAQILFLEILESLFLRQVIQY